LVITGNKSGFFTYDPETKRQSEVWHMPKLKSRVKSYPFQTLDSIQKAITDIKTLMVAYFQSCCEAWKILCTKCVASEGSNVSTRVEEPPLLGTAT
jgi:endonuclease III